MNFAYLKIPQQSVSSVKNHQAVSWWFFTDEYMIRYWYMILYWWNRLLRNFEVSEILHLLYLYDIEHSLRFVYTNLLVYIYIYIYKEKSGFKKMDV
jgi:hypothetical protein